MSNQNSTSERRSTRRTQPPQQPQQPQQLQQPPATAPAEASRRGRGRGRGGRGGAKRGKKTTPDVPATEQDFIPAPYVAGEGGALPSSTHHIPRATEPPFSQTHQWVPPPPLSLSKASFLPPEWTAPSTQSALAQPQNQQLSLYSALDPYQQDLAHPFMTSNLGQMPYHTPDTAPVAHTSVPGQSLAWSNDNSGGPSSYQTEPDYDEDAEFDDVQRQEPEDGYEYHHAGDITIRPNDVSRSLSGLDISHNHFSQPPPNPVSASGLPFLPAPTQTSASVPAPAPVPLPQQGPQESEVQRRLDVLAYERIGSQHDTLADHQSRRSTQRLPPPSLIADYDADWEASGGVQDCSSSLASFSTRNSTSRNSSTSERPSASLGSTGAVRTEKRNRRTRWQLLNSPSYMERTSHKLTREEKSNIKVAAIIYLEDICTEEPWRAGSEKLARVIECLSQANVRAMHSKNPTTEETSMVRDQIGHAGSNFRGALKGQVVDRFQEFWAIAYSRSEAKSKTNEECWLYTRSAVHELLSGSGFASQGSWQSPTGRDVPHFYNSEALHEFAVELFFKVWKGKKGEGKKTPIAQNAPFKYKPEFPRSALSLVVGMTDTVLEEHEDGVHKPRVIDDRTRSKILYHKGLMDKLYDHPVYGPKFKNELRKISDMGFALLNISSSSTLPPSIRDAPVDFDLTYEEVYGMPVI